ncbi:MAG TPA: hypothetical protein VMM93_04770 [Vicinamibacterales bacterium]|nr:hypothetical protein [Vicinamibacterales bacterium]
MKRVSIVLSTAAVVLWAAGAYAQAKPDFSGTWALDAEKTASANPEGAGGGRGGRGGGGGGGGAMTIKQDATSFTFTAGREGAQPVVYKLDGSDTQVPMGRGGMGTAKAMWEGSTIVINTTRDMQGTMMTTKAVYAMEGDWLVVSTTNPGREGGPATTFKRYYRKGM